MDEATALGAFVAVGAVAGAVVVIRNLARERRNRRALLVEIEAVAAREAPPYWPKAQTPPEPERSWEPPKPPIEPLPRPATPAATPAARPAGPALANLKLPRFTDLAAALDELDEPGAATEMQLYAVARMGILGDVPPLSRQQASALLSARTYAAAVLDDKLDGLSGTDEERDVIAAAVAFIVTDPELLQRVIAWNNRRFARGTHHSEPKPKRDGHYLRVEQELRRIVLG